MNNDMMEAYLYEMNTQLEQLEEIVLAAENAGSFSQEDVNEIFRIMHTVKGSSAMMEFNSLMTVSHNIEDLFFLIRDKGMDVVSEELKPELFDLIFKSIDFFRGEVGKLENNEPLSDSTAGFLETISSFSKKISAQEGGAPAANDAQEEESAPQETVSGNCEYGSPDFPNALQIFFDEIPDEEVRRELKGRGFKWARSVGAWQRQLTDNAIYAASRVKAIQPSDGSDPIKVQPKRKPKTGPQH